MPAPSAYKPSHPMAAAKPQRVFFDAFNSSATGHQRAENRLSGSTSWRDSRTLKLQEQFIDGHNGGRRMADTVGAGSEDFGKDGRLENGSWEKGAKGLRDAKQQSLLECLQAKQSKASRSEIATKQRPSSAREGEPINDCAIPDKTSLGQLSSAPDPVVGEEGRQGGPKQPQMFRDLVFHINGSTYPLVSDHKVKKIITEHGGTLSLSLARRTVTHVILGQPNAGGFGAGGGLAGSKKQKEITSMRGSKVRFVSADWILESIRRGRRAPESSFECVQLMHKRQPGMIKALCKTRE